MLVAKWSADSLIDNCNERSYISFIKDVSGNNNHGYGVNISKIYIQKKDDHFIMIGVKDAFTTRDMELPEQIVLGFNGHSFIRIYNSDFINLDIFIIKIRFYTCNNNRTQYIFDKRNSQWHRNYCLLYIADDFPHLREGMENNKWLLFDIGDGREMTDDFDNGIYFKIVEVINNGKWINAEIIYDGKNLVSLVNDKVMATKEVKFDDIKGNGDIIIGDASWPHTFDSWPINDTHPFFGLIDYIEIYNTAEMNWRKK